ncbi:MAG TPA: hypothetical protein VK674_05180 [Candidatus Limnocylindria bacterium]|nr:hypothetical protein [Candidatus Limnocylindria bacterium]
MIENGQGPVDVTEAMRGLNSQTGVGLGERALKASCEDAACVVLIADQNGNYTGIGDNKTGMVLRFDHENVVGVLQRAKAGEYDYLVADLL